MEIVHNTLGTGPTAPTEEEKKELYEVLDKIPQPRKYFELNEDQKILWYWFGKEFLKTRQFTEMDLPQLQRAAFWLDARNQAIKAVNAKGYDGGLVQKFNSGATNVSGHVSIIEKADKHLDDISAHFGLSFKDRKKLKIEAKDEGQYDLFEEFIKKQTS